MFSEPATMQKSEEMLLRIIRVADILVQALVEPSAYIAEEPLPDRKITENCVKNTDRNFRNKLMKRERV